jgi:nicotinate-nucleotide adenylyltransferase
MKIGLFGGTFDPIHSGHLIVAETMRSDFHLDRIVFIPASEPPHKQGHTLTSSYERKKMVKLALRGNPCFTFSDVELRRGGISYTIETIRWFQESKVWRKHIFFLIIGADNLLDMAIWKNPDEIFNSIHILVLARSGSDIEKIGKKIIEKVTIVATPQIEISSTQIRNRIRCHQSIRYWVPEAVERYIYSKGLYR